MSITVRGELKMAVAFTYDMKLTMASAAARLDLGRGRDALTQLTHKL